jgi:N-acetylmuramoyl-L-alanine amidase
VECGFLSNPEEETLLNTAQYQDKLVDALQKGICEYLEHS